MSAAQQMKDQIENLYFDYDRLSESGQKALDELSRLVDAILARVRAG